MADWKFELEDLEGGDGEDGEGDRRFDPRNLPVEPGSPEAENVAFVLLGVATAVYVFLQVV